MADGELGPAFDADDLRRRVAEVARSVVTTAAGGDQLAQDEARLLAQGVWVVGMSLVGIADGLQRLADARGS